MPGVQTFLPLMLNHVAHGRLTMQRLIELTSAGPQRVFGIINKGRIVVGYDADFSIVDRTAKWTIKQELLASKAGWSPFTGMEITGQPVGTIVRGHKVMWHGKLAPTAAGQPIRFMSTNIA